MCMIYLLLLLDKFAVLVPPKILIEVHHLHVMYHLFPLTMHIKINSTVLVWRWATKTLFRCEFFLNFATVALSFVCGKYCPIIDYN